MWFFPLKSMWLSQSGLTANLAWTFAATSLKTKMEDKLMYLITVRRRSWWYSNWNNVFICAKYLKLFRVGGCQPLSSWTIEEKITGYVICLYKLKWLVHSLWKDSFGLTTRLTGSWPVNPWEDESLTSSFETSLQNREWALNRMLSPFPECSWPICRQVYLAMASSEIGPSILWQLEWRRIRSEMWSELCWKIWKEI